jgi:transcriptional regulator with XRE-family HTH domain
MSDGDLFDNLPEQSEERPAEREQPHCAELPPEEDTVTEAGTAAAGPAAEAAPEPEPIIAPAVAEKVPPPTPKRRGMPLPHLGSLGQTLAELRHRNGMEIADVADETRIKPYYIEVLEKDAFSEIPHMVYVLAYVKKLCALYGVSGGDAEGLLSGLREELAYEIPEDIDKSVICREQDEDTRRKLRQISIALIAGAALIVLLLLIGITTLILRSRGGSSKEEAPAVEEQVSGDWLVKNQPAPQLKTTRIKLAPNRRRR